MLPQATELLETQSSQPPTVHKLPESQSSSIPGGATRSASFAEAPLLSSRMCTCGVRRVVWPRPFLPLTFSLAALFFRPGAFVDQIKATALGMMRRVSENFGNDHRGRVARISASEKSAALIPLLQGSDISALGVMDSSDEPHSPVFNPSSLVRPRWKPRTSQ